MKARIRKTGKIVDVHRTEDIITKRGIERQYEDRQQGLFYIQSELEFIKEPSQTDIDWEQRRLEIAKTAMQGILSNPNIIMSCGELEKDEEYIAKYSIIYANALITELKKGVAE